LSVGTNELAVEVIQLPDLLVCLAWVEDVAVKSAGNDRDGFRTQAVVVDLPEMDPSISLKRSRKNNLTIQMEQIGVRFGRAD